MIALMMMASHKMITTIWAGFDSVPTVPQWIEKVRLKFTTCPWGFEEIEK